MNRDVITGGYTPGGEGVGNGGYYQADWDAIYE